MSGHEDLRKKLEAWLNQQRVDEKDLYELILGQYLARSLTLEVNCEDSDRSVEVKLKLNGKEVARDKGNFKS